MVRRFCRSPTTITTLLSFPTRHGLSTATSIYRPRQPGPPRCGWKDTTWARKCSPCRRRSVDLLAGKASAQRRPCTTIHAGRAKVRKQYSLEQSYGLVIPTRPSRFIGDKAALRNDNGPKIPTAPLPKVYRQQVYRQQLTHTLVSARLRASGKGITG